MADIRSFMSGAKVLLAHFYFVNKGGVPFRPDFDWTSPVNLQMASLTSEQLRFVQELTKEVANHGNHSHSITCLFHND